MATPQQQRVAELRAQLAAQTPRVNGGLSLGGVNGALGVGSGAPGEPLKVVLEGDNIQDYSTWLATLELAQLEALAEQITKEMERLAQERQQQENASRDATGGRLDIPMAVPGDGTPSQDRPEQVPGRQDIPVAIPGGTPQQEIVQSTVNLSDREVQNAVAGTGKPPASISAFTRMDPEGRDAIKEMFKDGSAKPVYRVERGADGSYGRGEVIIQHADGREESFESFLDRQPENLVTPVRNSLDRLERSAPQQAPVNNAPEVTQGAGTNATQQNTSATPAATTTPANTDSPAATNAPAARGNVSEDNPLNRPRPRRERVSYQESFNNSMAIANKEGRDGMGFGTSVGGMAVVLAVGLNPWVGIPAVAIASYVIKPLGGWMAEQMSWGKAMDDVVDKIVVDLAELASQHTDPAERKAAMSVGFNKAVGQLGGAAAKKYLEHRREEIYNSAEAMPKDPEALAVMGQIVNDRELAKRERAQEPDNKWGNRGAYAVGAAAITAVIAPVVAPMVLTGTVTASGVATAVAGTVVGAIAGGSVGRNITSPADRASDERTARSDWAQSAAEKIADLTPQQQREVLQGLSMVMPEKTIQEVNDALDNRLGRNRAGVPEESRQPERGQTASQARSPQQVVMEYAEQVSRAGNMELAQSLANLASGRVQNGDAERVRAHTRESREQGTPVPTEVGFAVENLVNSQNRGGARSRVEQQQQAASTGRTGPG